MIQFIVGEKGRGKTKVLLEKANSEVKQAEGNFIYIDKNKQHMYELNNRIRLIDISGFPLTDCDEFIGFILGIISQDHDLENVYLDSFLKIARLEDGGDVQRALEQINAIGKQFSVNFIISISLSKEQLPEQFRENIVAEL